MFVFTDLNLNKRGLERITEGYAHLRSSEGFIYLSKLLPTSGNNKLLHNFFPLNSSKQKFRQDESLTWVTYMAHYKISLFVLKARKVISQFIIYFL